jgi:hypothetical protein
VGGRRPSLAYLYGAGSGAGEGADGLSLFCAWGVMVEGGDRASAAGGALGRLLSSIDEPRRGLPPVERWNPPYCGEIDMRIAADGSWHYNGSPIRRPALVKLFSTVLRKDPERFVLVTPVERVGIVVEDAPFVAVEMAVEGEGEARQIAFRTNVDDLVSVGPEHPLRFGADETGGVKPYVRVRGDLWARVTRALAFDLIELAEERETGRRAAFGVASGGAFFEIAAASDVTRLG